MPRPFFAFAFLLAGCGAAPVAPTPAKAPDSAAVAPAPVRIEKAAAPRSRDEAAQTFFMALAKHDAAAIERVAGDLARHVTREYADVSAVRYHGPVEASAWRGLDALSSVASLSPFGATVVRKGRSECVVVLVSGDASRPFELAGIRNLTQMAEEEPAPAPKKVQPVEARGELLKRTKSALEVKMGSSAPPAGTKAQLLRQIDASVPLVGGAWLVIAETRVTAVAGAKVKLAIVEEKSSIKMNGHKVDHFTPGAPIALKWTAANVDADQSAEGETSADRK